MRALTFEFDFRPIPLSLFIRSGALLQNAARTFSRQICRDDIIGMAQLCVEIMPSSTLLFCPSRLQACKYASQLGAAITNEVRELDARYVYKPQVFPKNKVLLHNPASLVRDCVAPLAGSSLFSLRLGLIADLAACGVALTSAARAGIAAGVCFHHGGMGPDARRIVEAALRERVICVLCCTTALAAGVNFPARRVIIAAPIVGHEQLSHEKFTQICGRAGRYGHDSVGEAVLFCSADTEALGWQLVAGGNRTVASSVLRMGMDRFLLEMVCCAAHAGGVASKGKWPKDVAFSELQSLTRLSLHAQCLVDAHASDATAAAAALAELDNAVVEQLQKLQADGFVVIDDERRCVRPTAEGSAVFVSFISMAAAEQLRRDVSIAGLSSGFNEVQLMHMLVPPIAAMLPRFDWLAIHDHVWPTLDKNMVTAAASLRVDERCLYLLAYTKGVSVAAEDELRMRRFICACMLIEFMANFDGAAVAAHFRVEIGAVHALQEASCAHAVCISDFMGICRMWCMQSMCVSAVQRMRSGGESEMHSLVQIRCCNAQRARALLSAGIKSPAHVASAGQSKVLEALVRNCGAQPQGIAAAIVQHAAFLIGQEVKMLQSRAKDLLRVKVS
jgi:replicative superfamily II helicase